MSAELAIASAGSSLCATASKLCMAQHASATLSAVSVGITTCIIVKAAHVLGANNVSIKASKLTAASCRVVTPRDAAIGALTKAEAAGGNEATINHAICPGFGWIKLRWAAWLELAQLRCSGRSTLARGKSERQRRQ